MSGMSGSGCTRVQRRIQAVVDGAAQASERAAVEAHAAGCPRCARELESSRRLVSLLAGVPPREVSAGFEAGLRAALAAAPEPTPAGAWWERFRLRYEWRLRAPALMTAGSVAVALVAVAVAPPVLERGERLSERREYLSAAVQRHKQLERAGAEVDWDALDASISLSAGSVVTE